MDELLLPLPPSVFRCISTEWAFWGVVLPYRHAYIWNWVLVEVIEFVVTSTVTILLYAVIPDIPDLSLFKLAVCCILAPYILAKIYDRLFAADLFVFAYQDSILVCKMSIFLMSDLRSIQIRSRVDVGLDHGDGRRQIRVLTENNHLLFGEHLSLGEQNCLLAEIKEAYFSWGKVNV